LWRGEFVCRISKEILECFGGAPGSGKTFSLAVSDIEALENKSGENRTDWYIFDKSGSKYWLTTNYNNPAKRFIEVLMELNPNIKVRSKR
jgi:hypothetical protein